MKIRSLYLKTSSASSASSFCFLPKSSSGRIELVAVKVIVMLQTKESESSRKSEKQQKLNF